MSQNTSNLLCPNLGTLPHHPSPPQLANSLQIGLMPKCLCCYERLEVKGQSP